LPQEDVSTTVRRNDGDADADTLWPPSMAQ
jgi:hypothetical protein